MAVGENMESRTSEAKNSVASTVLFPIVRITQNGLESTSAECDGDDTHSAALLKVMGRVVRV